MISAKKYLARGFVVFPVGLAYDEKKSINGKVKKHLTPEPGFTSLTLKTAKKLSFTKNGLGLLTGFGVMAVDIDNMRLWDHVLSELGQTEPETCKSVSQSGGHHLLFRANPALERLRKKSVFGLKPLGDDDFDILGKGDFLLVPPSSFYSPLGRREYTFVEGYSLIDNLDKLMDAPDWLIEVLTPGSVPYNRVRGSYIRQTMAEKDSDSDSDSESDLELEPVLTANEKFLLDLDLADRMKEVAKHVKKLSADQAIDRQSWIEVGMAIHHATDRQGMELWDKFSH
ncbi:hypothetical protein HK102_004355 [Quaeritorhiza haematococci]|nr:hypothetical protein HK102_004355 [Quaeritorhiza haematococci]